MRGCGEGRFQCGEVREGCGAEMCVPSLGVQCVRQTQWSLALGILTTTQRTCASSVFLASNSFIFILYLVSLAVRFLSDSR